MNYFWNKLFGVLNHGIFKDYYREWVKELKLEGNEKVMDFGCGVGGASFHIADRLSRGNGQLVCIDISETAINIAKKKLKEYSNVSFYRGNISDFSLDYKMFDMIYISYVLYHIDKKNREEKILELRKLLKDSGKIVIRNFIGEHSMTPENLKRFMQQCGFKEIEYRTYRMMKRIPAYCGTFVKSN